MFKFAKIAVFVFTAFFVIWAVSLFFWVGSLFLSKKPIGFLIPAQVGSDGAVGLSAGTSGVFHDARSCGESCGSVSYTLPDGGVYAPPIRPGVFGGEYWHNPPRSIVNVDHRDPLPIWERPRQVTVTSPAGGGGLVFIFEIFRPPEGVEVACSAHPWAERVETNPVVRGGETDRGYLDCPHNRPCLVSAAGRPMTGVIFSVGGVVGPEAPAYGVSGRDAQGRTGTADKPSVFGHKFTLVSGEDLSPPLTSVVEWTLSGVGLSAPDMNLLRSTIHVTEEYCRAGQFVWPGE